MNGQELFKGLSYIDRKYIDEAEYAELDRPVARKIFRKPLQVAAIIALTLLLVGCAVVYVLSMKEIKLGDQEVTYDVYDYDPRSGEALAYVGQDTMTQQVLTLAGLSNTPAAKAAREWYEFKEAYDPDRTIQHEVWGREPVFPAEYYGYNLYTREMKDKLDEILDKYDLKTMGRKIEFQSDKMMFKALGVETILNPGSDAVVDMMVTSFYENGSLNLHFLYDLPGEKEDIHTQGWLYYRNKDCLIPDTAILTEAQWEEWNYTTASGDQILIVCSEEAASAWFFSDLPNHTVSLRIRTVIDMYEEEENGEPVAKFHLLGKEQLERIADTFDFSLEPKLIDGWEDLDDGAVSMGQEINGYRIDVESAFTDGFAYQIVLKITAPEGVTIVDPEKITHRVDPGNGGFGRCEEDGDGLLNTCHYIITQEVSVWDRPADGSFSFPRGYVVPIYWEDMMLYTYDPQTGRGTDKLLTEGVWKFDVPLNETDCRVIEFVDDPVTAQGSVGWRMDGTDVLEDVEIVSIKLRTLGITVTCADEEKNADFFFFNGKSAYLGMADGSKLSHNFFGYDPIDLEQVVYLQLADGTVLPAPGREEEARRLIAEEASEPEETMPVFTDGVELLTESITMRSLAGYATDGTGDMDPLYEYFTVESITIHPWGLCIYCPAAFDSPDSEAVVTLKDGSEITLKGKNGAPYGPEPMNQLVADITIDLSQVEKIQLPDGTQLRMPTN